MSGKEEDLSKNLTVAVGDKEDSIQVIVYTHRKWFGKHFNFLREDRDSDWHVRKCTIPKGDKVKNFDFGLGPGKPIRSGAPTGGGFLLKETDEIIAGEYTLILRDEYTWDAGPFLSATAGSFLTTIIKTYDNPNSSPQFWLSVAGFVLWIIGLSLQFAGLVDFRSIETNKREKIFAELINFLIAIIVIVNSGLHSPDLIKPSS